MPNRLARERSPYLLQHANNPVDWYAWGADAFETARQADKPIFLSIGYSTCHWCHVMERESFEDNAMAKILNDHFVSIKVDREERPDVDRVYMTFVQATTGAGGWPMSVWLTPDLKPFLGGTYFPPESRWGRPGFPDILMQIAKAWSEDRTRILRSADTLMARLREATGADAPADRAPVAGRDALENGIASFASSFDARHGGFGGAPKFPRPSELLFLLTAGAVTGNSRARTMAAETLRAMAMGGIHDHVGGGFHRYSVDAEWRVPHFEKMLYDQAQLVLAYVEAAQASSDPSLLDVAEDTLNYVMREMTDAGGGFFSAEDADSVPPEQAADPHPHKAEGAFYLWRAAELDALLGDDAPVVKRRFGVMPDGNAPIDPQQEFTGKNLLYVAADLDELAKVSGKSEEDVAALLDRARVAMFKARLERPRPHLDDKVLTAWNGWMIAAFARTSRVVRAFRPERAAAAAAYRDAARRAASFLRERMWDDGRGTLLRRYRDGHAEIDAYAEDYACLVFGLIELFQADPDPAWLQWAVALQRRLDEQFWDEKDGGWFSTTGQDPTVLVRMKDDYDGAEPTASSMSVMNLIALSHLVEDRGWVERIERTFRLFGARLEQIGRAVPMMAAALSTWHAGVEQVVIAGDVGGDALERAVLTRYHPFAIVLRVAAAAQRALAPMLPWVAAMTPGDGQAAAYVCRQFACRQPVTSPEALEEELASGSRLPDSGTNAAPNL